MLILSVTAMLAALAAAVAYARRDGSLGPKERLALQRYSDKVHREEMLPFGC